jgi:hypothetical protein
VYILPQGTRPLQLKAGKGREAGLFFRSSRNGNETPVPIAATPAEDCLDRADGIPGRSESSPGCWSNYNSTGLIHRFKYRLALVADLVCVLRYDNEAGKGDHRHIGGVEKGYRFVDLETPLADFWNDVES